MRGLCLKWGSECAQRGGAVHRQWSSKQTWKRKPDPPRPCSLALILGLNLAKKGSLKPHRTWIIYIYFQAKLGRPLGFNRLLNLRFRRGNANEFCKSMSQWRATVVSKAGLTVAYICTSLSWYFISKTCWNSSNIHNTYLPCRTSVVGQHGKEELGKLAQGACDLTIPQILSVQHNMMSYHS